MTAPVVLSMTKMTSRLFVAVSAVLAISVTVPPVA